MELVTGKEVQEAEEYTYTESQLTRLGKSCENWSDVRSDSILL